MSIVWQRFKEGTFLALRADRLPQTVWGSNLRAFLPRSRWQELSRRTAELADQACEVCGRGPSEGTGLDCNEMWEFIGSGSERVQRLVGVIALCEWCHLTQHSGRAANVGRFEDVMMVLMGVNRWTHRRAMQDFDGSVAEFKERSQWNWDLDLRVLNGWFELDDELELLIPAADRDSLGNTYTKSRAEIRPKFVGDIPVGVWSWSAELPLKAKDSR